MKRSNHKCFNIDPSAEHYFLLTLGFVCMTEFTGAYAPIPTIIPQPTKEYWKKGGPSLSTFEAEYSMHCKI